MRIKSLFLFVVGNAAEIVTVMAQSGCKTVIDLVPLLDSSGSIGGTAWSKSVIPATQSLRGAMDISQAGVHMGLVEFSDDGQVVVALGDPASYDDSALRTRIAKMPFLGSGTDATAGFDAVRGMLPKRRSGVPLVVPYFSDGRPNDRATALNSAALLRQDGDVYILCLGVGAFDQQFMKDLCRDNKYIFSIADYDEMEDAILKIADTACNVATDSPTEPPVEPPTKAPTKKLSSKSPTTKSPVSTLQPTGSKAPTSNAPTKSPTPKDDGDLQWLWLLLLLLLLLGRTCYKKLACAACEKDPERSKTQLQRRVEKSQLNSAAGATGAMWLNTGGLATSAVLTAGTIGKTIVENDKDRIAAAQREAKEKIERMRNAGYREGGHMVVPGAGATTGNRTQAQQYMDYITTSINNGCCCCCNRRIRTKTIRSNVTAPKGTGLAGAIGASAVPNPDENYKKTRNKLQAAKPADPKPADKDSAAHIKAAMDKLKKSKKGVPLIDKKPGTGSKRN